MRALISSVGTRGDVQPVVALAQELRRLGHAARLCVPPNFTEWVAGLGFEAVPIGIEMRAPRSGAAPAKPPAIPDLITDQFDVLLRVVDGCQALVGGGAHQYAARSIAELRGLPFVEVVYAPVSLPCGAITPGGTEPTANADENLRLWEETKRAWNARSLQRVNSNRARLGLAAIDDVISHILGDAPWLAADATLAPAPMGVDVVQTGAWNWRDESPLAPELEAFLRAGEPPLYVGLGSMPAPEGTSRILIEAARARGRRLILSRGWAELQRTDQGSDCIEIDDVNQQALFRRVAAVVHHGGAGTTTVAAQAGVAQIAVPLFGDQFYFARRIRELGVGAAVPFAKLAVETLTLALQAALEPAVAEAAQSLAAKVAIDGAERAARRLVA